MPIETMKVDEITTDLLRQTLNSWQKGHSFPEVWAALGMLLPAAGGRQLAQISIALHDLLSDMVVENLSQQRAAEGLPAADWLAKFHPWHTSVHASASVVNGHE